jgi:hypothetical protein
MVIFLVVFCKFRRYAVFLNAGFEEKASSVKCNALPASGLSARDRRNALVKFRFTRSDNAVSVLCQYC